MVRTAMRHLLLADSPEAEVTRTAPSTAPTRGDLRHGFVYERPVQELTGGMGFLEARNQVGQGAVVDTAAQAEEEKPKQLPEPLSAVIQRETFQTDAVGDTTDA